MGSLATLMPRPQEPTPLLSYTQQQGITNSLAQQKAQTGLTTQQTEVQRQEALRLKQEAEARARELRDQDILTRGMAEVYGGKKEEPETASPSVSVEQGAPADSVPPIPQGSPQPESQAPAVGPGNSLATAPAQTPPVAVPAAPTAAPANTLGMATLVTPPAGATAAPSGITDPQGATPTPTPAAPANSLNTAVTPQPTPAAPVAQPAPAVRQPETGGLPAPKKLSYQEANDQLERYAIQNGISAPGLAAWRQQRYQMESNAEKLTKDQRENLLGQHAIEQAALEGLKETLRTETDPAIIAQEVAKTAKVVPGFDPSDIRPQKIESLIHGLEMIGGIVKGKHEEATLAEAQAKADQANRSNDAAQLAAGADSNDKDVYAAALAKVPAERRKEWPTADQFEADPEAVAARIRTQGSPIALQAKTLYQQEREQRLKDTAGMVNDQRKAMLEVAKDRAKTYAARAGVGNGTTASGIAFRFNRREADQIDKEEAQLHLKINDLSEQIGTKSVTNFATGLVTAIPDTAPYQRRLDGLKDRVQTLQINKAKNLGFQAPSAVAAKGVAEGSEFSTPDGSVWQKHDGVLYWDRGPAATPAGASAANAPTAPSGTISEREATFQRNSARDKASVAAPGPANPQGNPAPRKINHKTGQTIVLKNNAWVDEKTGQPVQ